MSDRLKLAMVGPYPVGRPLSNGVEAVTVGMVQLLAERDDIDLEVVTVVFDAPDQKVVENGVTIHAVGSSDRLRRITLYRSERAGIARVVSDLDADIVHAQGANFYGLGALQSDLPTVITLHGMLFREAKIVDPRSSLTRKAQTRLRGYFNARFEADVLARATNIISISEYVNASIDGRTDAELHAIGNPIDASFFDVPDRTEQGRLLCVARIEPRKGQHHLVEAVRLLRDQGLDVTLRLVGKPVDDGYHRAVSAAIEDAGLADRITLTGIVSDAELLEEYSRAMAVVMASREETSPMAFQQAMAGGTPVIGPAVAGVPYLIEHDQNGLLVAGTDLAPELADAISAVVGDDGLRARLGSAGRATAEARFRADRVGEQTVAVYRTVLDRAPTTSTPR